MNKKQFWLYAICVFITCIIIIFIYLMTCNIVSNIRYDNKTSAYSMLYKTDFVKQATEAITEQTEILSGGVVNQTETTDPVENEILKDIEISETTPEVETGKSRNDCFVVYDDGRIAYIVQKGDTLSYVSTLTGYSVDELANINHIKDVNLIYSGSAIMIPQ